MVMKATCILLAIISLSPLKLTHDRTLLLLQWLIKRDRIEYLNKKSNAAPFYDQSRLSHLTVLGDSGKTIPNKHMSDFVSHEEMEICKTVPPMLEQSDWGLKYSLLKVKFVTDKVLQRKKGGFTAFSFSEPIFLNKECTRVIIGESFFCGIECGRDDLLLCKYKNGRWNLIARAVVASD